MSGLYLQPTGIGAGPAFATAAADGAALPLAGGPLWFTGALVIEGTPGRTRQRYLSASALGESSDRALASLLQRVSAPRLPVAGLALNRPHLMGIVNVTPDSFSDGGCHESPQAAIAHAFRLIEEGAEILDIGGESTRPGSDPVPLELERARVLPVLQALRDAPVLMSLDTRKAALMRAAGELGVGLINDVSALTYDEDAGAVLAGQSCAVVLMHARGDPKTMQDDPRYDDVALEVHDALAGRLVAAQAAGIARDRLIVDPGIGFGKSFSHNVELMQRLALLHGLGVPLLVGVSRKGFIGHITGVEVAAERLAGSLAMMLAAVGQGAQIVRVHDVKESRQALAAWLRATGLDH